MDQTISFAQDGFFSDAWHPTNVSTRTPIPGWVASASAETTIPADGDHCIRTENPDVDGGMTQEVLTKGTTPDALAYYLPFHFYRASWGIYVRASGVCALAEHLGPEDGKIAAMDFSYRLLLEHERLHFFAEYAASRIEVISGESCYKEYFADADATCHEEALANAHSFCVVGCSAPRRLAGAAEAWMLTQPEGYRDFKQWLPPRFQAGRRRAACCMSPVKAMTNVLGRGSHPAEFVFFRINPRRCPVRIVLGANAPWLRVAKPFPKQFGLQVYVFPNDHKPAHIHIDRPPGTPYTRYLWPDLTPYPNDARLRSSEEKALRRYVSVHGARIAQKVGAVVWQ